MYRWRNRGLGEDLREDSSGNVIDCDLWSNFFQSVCWIPGATVTTPVLPEPPIPASPGAPSGSALTVPPASGAEAQSTVDALVTAAGQQTQANTQSFYNALPSDLVAQPCNQTIVPLLGICDTTVYLVGGIGAAALLLMAFAGRRRR